MQSVLKQQTFPCLTARMKVLSVLEHNNCLCWNRLRVRPSEEAYNNYIHEKQYKKRSPESSSMHNLHVKTHKCTYHIIQSSVDGCSHEFCLRCIKKWSRVKLCLFRLKTHVLYVVNVFSKSKQKIRPFKQKMCLNE